MVSFLILKMELPSAPQTSRYSEEIPPSCDTGFVQRWLLPCPVRLGRGVGVGGSLGFSEK
jgi:hypothetical protein